MHFYKPNQIVKIVTVHLAVPGDLDADEIVDGIGGLLSESQNKFILDWRYKDPERIVDKMVRLGTEPEEGEAFDRNPVPNERAFEVCVLRNCQQHLWIHVKARDEVEAGERALDKAPNEDFSGTGRGAEYEVDEIKEAR